MTFLKWVGGKQRLFSQIYRFFPSSCNNYFEPFLGGGSVFFNSNYQNCYLNDMNKELIITYKVVKDAPEKCIAILSNYIDNHCEDFYYQTRSSIPKTEYEIAARFIYLNRTCFNGLYRVNRRNQFNVPMGKYKNPFANIIDMIEISSYTLNRRNPGLYCEDYSVLLNKSVKGDFVYLDPPYYPINDTSNFTSYTPGTFDKFQHIRLFKNFKKLAEKGVSVIMSNSYCEYNLETYKDYNKVAIEANRLLAAKGKSRGKKNELLIMANL